MRSARGALSPREGSHSISRTRRGHAGCPQADPQAGRLDRPYVACGRRASWCPSCRAEHVPDGLFRAATLPGGLHLRPVGNFSAVFAPQQYRAARTPKPLAGSCCAAPCVAADQPPPRTSRPGPAPRRRPHGSGGAWHPAASSRFASRGSGRGCTPTTSTVPAGPTPPRPYGSCPVRPFDRGSQPTVPRARRPYPPAGVAGGSQPAWSSSPESWRLPGGTAPQ